mmetsp:Transcript_105776/g.305993  ORF Transcript_105776/g.305993 Transcript_105776/m.305993 type:complete len:683 (-) Transcript_105776:87-2135(-)|eukprot:CAMPEP_0176020344 /NCGR_PEP_ID=MMETSP0120_2-20121206/9852_1 /TAXON_ID=160619 /ORGANISM="Kryptoperidinium foliaceum, Strain CCMP 1326" /LENGTH=682 /DNA_ID=CAMNT_0017353437 /DNA_START=151 /DNA_END=2199 /DNA_ORIENTATION=-
MKHPRDNLPLLLVLAFATFGLTDGFVVVPSSRLDNASVAGRLYATAVKRKGGGGRAAGTEDNVKDSAEWKPTPCSPEEARLTVVQITDTYTLEHLPSVKTLLQDVREKSKGSTVISCMTGDFLAPYLLSSVDRGQGMMNAMMKIPIDYLTWGNHEADINHKTVCKHVKNYYESGGIWLNSNMLDHEAMEYQKEFDIVEVTSPDGSNKRKVGLVALLSDDPKLYEQFKAPGAFGGATVTNPWDKLKELKPKLEGPDYGCDCIIPMQHTYVPDDHKTCEMFDDLPVLLSGHDHHKVDEVIHGTRLLKPGMDSVYATILEMIWPNADAVGKDPIVKATFVKTSDWEPEPVLAEECERAYDALEPLRNTELARVPPNFQPLSSVNSRGTVTTMGQYICTLIRSSLNVSRRQRSQIVDAVMLMGGNIRGGTDYETGSFFSLEALEAEIKSDEVIAVVPMPGWLLAEGVQATHIGDPKPGWMQYDNGVFEDFSQDPPVVTQVRGRPLVPDQVYRVATKISDLTNGQSPPWTKYYKEHPEALPPKGAYSNIQAELMAYFARNLWRRIWDSLSQVLDSECDSESVDLANECQPEARLETLDADNDGKISVEEIQTALGSLVGLSIDERELTLAQFVHDFADTNGNGEVTLQDLEVFCDEMTETYERDQWRLAFKKTEMQPKKAPEGVKAT